MKTNRLLQLASLWLGLAMTAALPAAAQTATFDGFETTIGPRLSSVDPTLGAVITIRNPNPSGTTVSYTVMLDTLGEAGGTSCSPPIVRLPMNLNSTVSCPAAGGAALFGGATDQLQINSDLSGQVTRVRIQYVITCAGGCASAKPPLAELEYVYQTASGNIERDRIALVRTSLR